MNFHDDEVTQGNFLWEENISHRWIPLSKGRYFRESWCCLCCQLEQVVEKTMELMVIGNAMTLIICTRFSCFPFGCTDNLRVFLLIMYLYIFETYIPLFFRATLLPPKQSYGYPRAIKRPGDIYVKIVRSISTTKYNKALTVDIIRWMYCKSLQSRNSNRITTFGVWIQSEILLS